MTKNEAEQVPCISLLAVIREQEESWRQLADIEDSPLGGNVVKAAMYRGTATGLKMAEQIIMEQANTRLDRQEEAR